MSEDQENITQLHPTQREFEITAYEFGDNGVVSKVEISNDEFQENHVLMTVISDPKFNPDDWMIRVAVAPENHHKLQWYMNHMNISSYEDLIGHDVIVNSIDGELEFAFLDPRWINDEMKRTGEDNG